MKILDYEGLKQVVSKIKELIEKKAEKLDLEDKTKFFDTRDKSENPEWYIKNKSQSTFRELKKSQDINIKEGNESDYWLLLTMFGWSDTSAGYPIQISLSSMRPEVYFRIGISNTEWSEWKRLLNDEDLRLSLSDMADDAEHRTVTDDEKSYWNKKADKTYVDSFKNSTENQLSGLNKNINEFKNDTETKITSINKDIDEINSNISADIMTRIKQLENGLYNDVTSNPFSITFKDINGVVLTNGVYNQDKARLEC